MPATESYFVRLCELVYNEHTPVYICHYCLVRVRTSLFPRDLCTTDVFESDLFFIPFSPLSVERSEIEEKYDDVIKKVDSFLFFSQPR